jgi:hypothetical protein
MDRPDRPGAARFADGKPVADDQPRKLRMKYLAGLLGVALCLAAQVAVAQPAVNRIVAVVNPRAYDGPCPATITFTGTIFVNRPARVSYRWERSDHATGPVETVQVSGGGRGVKTEWHLGNPRGQAFHGSETLHVLSPGDFYSNPAEFTLVCR